MQLRQKVISVKRIGFVISLKNKGLITLVRSKSITNFSYLCTEWFFCVIISEIYIIPVACYSYHFLNLMMITK